MPFIPKDELYDIMARLEKTIKEIHTTKDKTVVWFIKEFDKHVQSLDRVLDSLKDWSER